MFNSEKYSKRPLNSEYGNTDYTDATDIYGFYNFNLC
jgi:hypothetical protein